MNNDNFHLYKYFSKENYNLPKFELSNLYNLRIPVS